jgi:lysosomal alpha-mannosidase
MTHRRLLHDDWKGVFEPLNETAFGTGLVVRGTHYLIISGNGSSAAQQTRSLGQELYRQPQISFIETSQSFTEWSINYKTQACLLILLVQYQTLTLKELDVIAF